MTLMPDNFIHEIDFVDLDDEFYFGSTKKYNSLCMTK